MLRFFVVILKFAPKLAGHFVTFFDNFFILMRFEFFCQKLSLVNEENFQNQSTELAEVYGGEKLGRNFLFYKHLISVE